MFKVPTVRRIIAAISKRLSARKQRADARSV